MKFLTLLFIAAFAGTAGAASLSRSLETIRAVGPEGKGNAEAGAAWKTISAGGAEALLPTLKAMNGANELAVNWLRAAVEAISAAELGASRPLPMAALEKFLQDTKNSGPARRLAWELIARADAAAGERLIAGMVNDPGKELRRDAVQRQLDAALAVVKSGRSNEALPKFQALLPSARDVDHVEIIARNLKALGHPVDLPKTFGWLTEWKVIGPFDSTGGVGFNKVYPPEERIDFAAEYDGKNGKVRWQDQDARGDLGLVDLNKPCGMLKGVAGYAYAEFNAAKAGPAELRLGCENAWKIWVNGKFIFGRDEYHRGMEVDQYRLPVELKKGKNIILVKLCQDEMKEKWTEGWEFQLRITDSLGAPIASAKK